MGDRAYLILSLGWAPTQDKLDWADKIIKANPDKNVIVTTHAFMYWDGTHLNDEDLDYTSGYTQDGMDGSEIWEQLGKKNENVVLAIGGQMCIRDSIRASTIVGMVGGGGVGLTLFSYIKSFRYDIALTIILLIAAMVIVVDQMCIRDRSPPWMPDPF